MDDIELTFDDVFPSFHQPDQEAPATPTSINVKSPTYGPFSPMLPKAPNPTTTVTPVHTPAVVQAPWNFKVTLEEAFPNAEFVYTEYDDETMTLEDWLHLKDFESPSEDYRIAVLVRDRLPWKKEKDDIEPYLMSGALPNDEEEDVAMPTAGLELESVKNLSNETSEGNSKDAKGKENISVPSDDDYDYDASEDDGYHSDAFDDKPYGTGLRNGWD